MNWRNDCLVTHQPCAYRLLRNGVVIYIGSTANFLWRMAAHTQDKTFDAVEWTPFKTIQEARVFERAEILRLLPRLNRSRIRRAESLLLAMSAPEKALASSLGSLDGMTPQRTVAAALLEYAERHLSPPHPARCANHAAGGFAARNC